MTAKQSVGRYSPDGSKYGSLTNGSGTLDTHTTSANGSTKQLNGSQAPDGSIYFTLTDGNGSLR